MITITTWNIRHGGGSRLQQITGVLDSYSSSDVVGKCICDVHKLNRRRSSIFQVIG